MQVGIMITNGGTHSAEKWAAVTAAEIIQIAADSASLQAIEGRKLELRILDILEAAHAGVKTDENATIAEVGNQHVNTEIAPGSVVDDTLAKIVAAAQDTLFKDWFNNPEVQAVFRQSIGNHFATSIWTERSWHADQHPNCPHCTEFRNNR
jgi:hypothetical protein